MRQVGAGHIANKDIVPRLLAITVNDRTARPPAVGGKNATTPASPCGSWQWSVDIGITQGNVRNAVLT